MNDNNKRGGRPSRRHAILESLARELECPPGERITTASLARAVGVSEAALYRHFPSKAKMFEALIDFIEESVFSLINRIMAEEDDVAVRCEKIMVLMLGFAERNPGMSRILMGDALTGEKERLRSRISQFFDRVETQLKQVFREGRFEDHGHSDQEVQAGANLLLAVVEGRLSQFVRSGFTRSPLDKWDTQWAALKRGLFN